MTDRLAAALESIRDKPCAMPGCTNMRRPDRKWCGPCRTAQRNATNADKQPRRGGIPTADRGCPTCGMSYAEHAKCAGCHGMIGPPPHMIPISTAHPMYCVGCVQARIRRGEL